MKYEQDLGRNPANYAPLTPLSFIERAAYVYPQRLAVVYEDERYTWKETYARSRRLASALSKRGIGPGDTVAVLLPNTPPMYEAHFGVPMCGAVLNTLNTRLDASAIEFMLKHGEAKLLVVDREFKNLIGRPGIPVIDDSEYESFLKEGDPEYEWRWPKDEWEAISLNYTSGTTGDPKGVVYHHRGAYLNALCNIVTWAMPHHAVYLWTLPMFHCNGWTFPWTMAANAGTNVCLRKVEAQKIFDLIRKERVTHYCGAPIVHSTLINAPEEMKKGITHKVNAMVAAAAPPAAMIEGMERMGWNITHVYGLTETYGPHTVCAWDNGWDALPADEMAQKAARQGQGYVVADLVRVVDDHMNDVPMDAQTLGEVVMRGNNVMKGYFEQPDATADAFRGGWFHSGDLAVWHPDGYIELRDRKKDIIISGGENISTIEVEQAVAKHPAVLECAVVAVPDEKWGERPKAFVTLKPGMQATEADIIEHCRTVIAHFKCPAAVEFGDLPKTSTGKVQKFVLRNKEWAGKEKRIN